MNVPVANGSVVDLVCWHERPVTVEAVNEVVRTAAAQPTAWKRILGYETEPIVSSDILLSAAFGRPSTASRTMVLGSDVSKTLTWFDNGWGYAAPRRRPAPPLRAVRRSEGGRA